LPKLTLRARFTYHAPTTDQIPRYEAIRKAALRFARVLEKNCPHAPSEFGPLWHVEAAVMLANKSIALEKFKRE
jgi:hypothetical protein